MILRWTKELFATHVRVLEQRLGQTLANALNVVVEVVILEIMASKKGVLNVWGLVAMLKVFAKVVKDLACSVKFLKRRSNFQAELSMDKKLKFL